MSGPVMPAAGPPDVIEIRGIRGFGRHGVFDHERAEGQEFVVDVRLELDTRKAAATDDLADTVNYGVVGIPKDEPGARKVFEFAKTLGLRAVTTESADAIDTIDKLVKEFDVMVAFHDHPKRPNNPEYRMWDPNYILSLVKDRDKRIGACADTGHWVRSGIKPVDAPGTIPIFGVGADIRWTISMAGWPS